MTPSITFTTDDAIQIASNYWGIEAQAQALAGEADRNFVLVTAGGDRFVLKVSPPGDSRDAVECQVKALQHFSTTPVSGLVPQVLPIFDGSELLSVEVDGHQCWARMVSYLDGTPAGPSSDSTRTRLCTDNPVCLHDSRSSVRSSVGRPSSCSMSITLWL